MTLGMPSRNELISAVNVAIDVTNNSKAGPIFTEPDELGTRHFNTLGLQTYYILLQKILPQSIDARMEATHEELK